MNGRDPTNTDQKIMKAALKVFAQKSYQGSTTREIAEEAGFSELTLFRRFKNKKTLFNIVWLQYLEKFKTQLQSANEELFKIKFESPREFLKTLVRHYVEIIEHNIELIRILIFDTSIEAEPIKELVFSTEKLLEKKIQNDKIEYLSFALTITGTLIMLSNDNYLKRPILDYDKFIENFTNNFLECI
jgi:TetR/AcrR family transcriptional regulator